MKYKLTTSQCRAIRKQYEAGKNAAELGPKYRVSCHTIVSAIKRAGGRSRTKSESAQMVHIFTMNQCRAIRKQYDSGKNGYELGLEHGVCAATIIRAIKRAGGEARANSDSHGHKITLKQAKAIRKQYEAGKTLADLEQKYNCSQGPIRSAVLRAGGKIHAVGRITVRRLRYFKGKLVEHVKFAEKLTKENGGKLPSPSALTDKLHLSGLQQAIKSYPEAFSHLEQERLYRPIIRSDLVLTPEYKTVAGHHYLIFDSQHPSAATYKGMPFYSKWSPDKGGSWGAGAKWIIENLGKRPEGTSLHVVPSGKGFVPGNLEWAYPKKQSAEKMHKVIANKDNEIKRLRKQLSELQKAV